MSLSGAHTSAMAPQSYRENQLEVRFYLFKTQRPYFIKIHELCLWEYVKSYSVEEKTKITCIHPLI